MGSRKRGRSLEDDALVDRATNAIFWGIFNDLRNPGRCDAFPVRDKIREILQKEG